MKRILFITLTLIIAILTACTEDYTSSKYIQKVISNLEDIESASYSVDVELWAPGDTAAQWTGIRTIREYNNPSDTTIGANYVEFIGHDTLRAKYCYDGAMLANIIDKKKIVVVDSFKVWNVPFRPVNPPFFNYIKSILTYAVNTTDSVILDIQDLHDAVYLKLTINEEKQVEFFGKATYMPLSPYSFDNTSIYEIWIAKKDNMPYKVRREMSHNISVATCRSYEINNLNASHFIAKNYFPKNYEIKLYGVKKTPPAKHPLLRKQAPDWNLQSSNNKAFSLKDFRNKVTLIQFTSVTCGPCKASIPFLKQLSGRYNDKIFDLVSIECTTNNSNALKSYRSKNEFDYKFLMSTKEIINNYSIQSFPVFFILDKNHMIVDVINGYSKDVTDRIIKESIDKLI
ncbi:TlpA family protein disulfide reductase [Saccharicrinis aurantiacus]|uniref:TlpA family protein disulfide reductase n=1 Tax=Saccharicrinis aurantiacus TaxID=1849719 RepID=UPI00248F80BA|nr:TlpA disulfide reductase family protein [Saccharicrinis aurantiacus]